LSLINCPECNKEISNQAKSCPNCGYEIAKLKDIEKKKEDKKNLRIGCIVVIVIAIIIAISIGICDNGDDNTDTSTINLNASVNFTGTQFIITNNDSFDYVNAEIELNGKYQLKGYTLKAKEVYTVGMMQFADKDGNRFGMYQKPTKFSIWCDVANRKGFYYAEWQ